MTATAAHTPGPWLLEPDRSEPCQLFLTTGRRDGPEWLRFATVVVRMEDEVSGDISNDPEGWANARLISAAPDLYEALQTARIALIAVADSAVEEGFGPLADIIDDQLGKANSALAKARGDQS